MRIVESKFISGRKVLLRYDIDVALGKDTGGRLQVTEEFKLKAGLKTLKLCLENASKVIIIGHLGRPAPPKLERGEPAPPKLERGEPFARAEDEKNGPLQNLSARPVFEWFRKNATKDIEFALTLEHAQSSNNKAVLLENIRFFHGEVPGSQYHATCTSKTCDVDFAKKLASLGEVYVNEAFSSHNKAASTTIVPALMPHAAGLHFAEEIEVLQRVRDNPKKPLVAIMGGAKVQDKLPVITVLAQKADAVLVGGKLVHEIREQKPDLPKNVLVGKLNGDGFDIAAETSQSWKALILKAATIIWNGPLGKFEDPGYDQTRKVAEMILGSKAAVVIGGGDSVAALSQYGLLEKAQQKAFVSVGGGAMLKLLSDGTLPTIEALK